MLWIKAFHVIFIVTWFAGLFYLPRLFVYHAMSQDPISIDRFKIMERKLYFGIATPSAILATLFGIWMIWLNPTGYLSQGWMHAKLSFVVLLWAYHLYCYKFLRDFRTDNNKHSHVFYRWFNEAPALILVAIIILVIVKPF
ncbi:MAG: protoporphyrinogen oxidase HemJ [Pseudomonadota bacterium]|nr:protoporphyrinogen oxidase HemJ [Pseudomonadota bacterium]